MLPVPLLGITSLKPSSPPTTCHAQDYGELEGHTGYWAAEEDIGLAGFVQEFKDVFWTYDDVAGSWISKPFRGRRLVKGSREREHIERRERHHICSLSLKL